MISASVFPVLLRKFVGTHRTEVRSLLKAVSWRFFGSLVTVFIAFLLTRKLGLSLSIGAFEFVGKIALYYLHDRIWDRIF
ncbi:MAG: DUF2061 domain-containing protein [Bacteroidota bacterium]|nr:DUF2061 domain-containing protein [Bacteroidota bacterium]